MLKLGRMISRLPWRCPVPWMALLFSLLGGIAAGFGAALALMGAAARWLGAAHPLTGVAGMAGELLMLPLLLAVFYRSMPIGKLGAKLGIRTLRGGDVGAALLGIAAILVVGNSLTALWGAFLDWRGVEYVREQSILLFAINSPPPVLAALAVMVVILVPILEEILFRRILYGLFRPLGGVAALLLTAAVFSAVHFFLLGIPALFLMGLVFQLVYLVRRNLAAAVLTHMMVNFLAMAGALLEQMLKS